ncbi:olfactory receptor 4D11-like [Betta splendens]|uniref:Olfactory receptor 4D11-like n=1 Tax=Betta splendens TaxID=158456 RepID=A0A9W2Y7N1_BETSP|nr:olfactory receptor 4D11-like [Betta splendens]
MSLQNASFKVAEFIIAGLDTTKSPLLVGVVMLIIYFVSVVANMVNIVIIIYSRKLHKPMYLLICDLAIVDILYTSSASPTMIAVLVSGIKTISYVPCFIQLFAFNLGAVMEMFALAVMAFDRLIAVSCPFQYQRYLTNARVLVVTCLLWIVASGFVAVFPATVIPLPQCNNVLRYTFCSYGALVRTTCADPDYYFNLSSILIFFLSFFTFGFILLSYFGIIFFVKSLSICDKKKMASTCLSHLIVVICYYIPILIVALLTRFGVVLTIEERNGLLIGTILGPCIVNPFVYCLRTKKIKIELIRVFKKAKISQ